MTTPKEIAKEAAHEHDHLKSQESCLFYNHLALDLKSGKRIVCANDGFVARIPFWASWPFETLLAPRRHSASLNDFVKEDARTPTSSDDLPKDMRRFFQQPVHIMWNFTGVPVATDPIHIGISRPLLPVVTALGDDLDIHDGFRTTRIATAQHHAGRRHRAASPRHAELVIFL